MPLSHSHPRSFSAQQGVRLQVGLGLARREVRRKGGEQAASQDSGPHRLTAISHHVFAGLPVVVFESAQSHCLTSQPLSIRSGSVVVTATVGHGHAKGLIIPAGVGPDSLFEPSRCGAPGGGGSNARGVLSNRSFPGVHRLAPPRWPATAIIGNAPRG